MTLFDSEPYKAWMDFLNLCDYVDATGEIPRIDFNKMSEWVPVYLELKKKQQKLEQEFEALAYSEF